MVTVGGLWCAELDLVLFGDRPVVVVPGCLCLQRQPHFFFDESSYFPAMWFADANGNRYLQWRECKAGHGQMMV